MQAGAQRASEHHVCWGMQVPSAGHRQRTASCAAARGGVSCTNSGGVGSGQSQAEEVRGPGMGAVWAPFGRGAAAASCRCHAVAFVHCTLHLCFTSCPCGSWRAGSRTGCPPGPSCGQGGRGGKGAGQQGRGAVSWRARPEEYLLLCAQAAAGQEGLGARCNSSHLWRCRIIAARLESMLVLPVAAVRNAPACVAAAAGCQRSWGRHQAAAAHTQCEAGRTACKGNIYMPFQAEQLKGRRTPATALPWRGGPTAAPLPSATQGPRPGRRDRKRTNTRPHLEHCSPSFSLMA